jgi:hypothetical protein
MAVDTKIEERPILFSAPMVRAILAGKKTQTRRVIKPQPIFRDGWWECPRYATNGERSLREGLPYFACPYSGVDQLWVRESFWQQNDTCDHEYCAGCDMGPLPLDYKQAIDYVATPNCFNPPELAFQQTVEPWTEEPVPGEWWLSPPLDWDGYDDEAGKHRGVWNFLPWNYHTKRPSIFLPRWASRLTLELTEVRAERIQEISVRDAIAEGVPSLYRFRELWNDLNEKRGFGWDANPWVWVISFQKA